MTLTAEILMILSSSIIVTKALAKSRGFFMPGDVEMDKAATDYALELIKRWEGCRLSAYADIGGVWTIGWGATGAGIKKGVEWTQKQADERLASDLKKFEEGVDSLVSVPLSPDQRGALYSLAYNIGIGAFSKSTLLRKLNASDYKGAAAQFLRWNKVNGRVSKGLVNRRAEERRMFEGKADEG